MPTVEKEIIIRNAQGLHARPAAMFVQTASKYNSNVTLKKGDEEVNGKSIMGILTLGVQKNTMLIVRVEGDDAQEALIELEKLLTSEEING